ncbi:MAG: hypothetical protein PHF44_00295 [Candidatus Pacebacteria bacterium]|nr:hypothetical protein [Candidatus Paceibacterota bacterium]
MNELANVTDARINQIALGTMGIFLREHPVPEDENKYKMFVGIYQMCEGMCKEWEMAEIKVTPSELLEVFSYVVGGGSEVISDRMGQIANAFMSIKLREKNRGEVEGVKHVIVKYVCPKPEMTRINALPEELFAAYMRIRVKILRHEKNQPLSVGSSNRSES